MTARRLIPTAAAFTLALLTTPSVGLAQGIIWQLPEENLEVKYEGDYIQQNFRSESGEVAEEIRWKKVVIIRALDRQQAQYNGEEVTCRWVEISVVAGFQSEGGLDPGPVGPRVYKVLIPEKRVYSELVGGRSIDEETIFISHLPIIEGYVKTGGNVVKDNGTVEQKTSVRKLNTPILQVYPTLALVHHYKTMQQSPQTELQQVIGTEVEVRTLQGKRTIESRTYRTNNSVTLHRCDNEQVAPFGVTHWQAELLLEKKDSVESREEFTRVSKITEVLDVVSVQPSGRPEVQVP